MLNPSAEEWCPIRIMNPPSPPQMAFTFLLPSPHFHYYQYHHHHYYSFQSWGMPTKLKFETRNPSHYYSFQPWGMPTKLKFETLNPKTISKTTETPSPNTTVMIKNIPNKLRRDFMLSFLDRCCEEHGLEYDFFYLPMDFRRKDNLGYAFVNLTTGETAQKLKELMHNFRWENIEINNKGGGYYIRSKKVCETSWAKIQGKNRLVKRFQDSVFACDKIEYLPVVLEPPRNRVETDPVPPRTVGKLGRRKA